MINLILATLKSIADAIRGWLSWSVSKEKKRTKAADETTKKQFWVLLLLMFILGCSRTPPVTMTFHPTDYQERKAGESFVFPKTGFFMSEDVRKAYEAGVITEYYIRRHGFYIEKREDE